MKIADVSNIKNQTFGNLFYNSSIMPKLDSSRFSRELSKIQHVITKNKLDKKRYVDIYIGHDAQKGFYALVSGKNQGIPNSPDAIFYISPKDKVIRAFKSWLQEWNHDYSPKGSAKWRKLKGISSNQ